MVHAHGEMGSAVRECGGVDGSRIGDFIEELELTEDVRVDLRLESPETIHTWDCWMRCHEWYHFRHFPFE